MNLKNKKIGIWGFGIVGKSAAKYLVSKSFTNKFFTQNLQDKQMLEIQILDKRELTEQEKVFIETNNITFINQNNSEKFKNFLENNDLIITSAGIDLRNYKQYAHKFISELDLFAEEFKIAPIIGITGTVGKTTITHMLDQIIKAQGVNIWTGGNIGAGVLDVLEKNLTPDLVLLELSSFQLELCKNFAPDLAVWTNFFPNHLDKHSNIEEYFMAKMQILLNQNSEQYALLPINLLDKLEPFLQKQDLLTAPSQAQILKSRIYFFSEKIPSQELISKLRPQDSLLYLDQNDQVIKYTPPKLGNQSNSQIDTPSPFVLSSQSEHSSEDGRIEGYVNQIETIGSITQLAKLAEFTFRENLLIIYGSLYIFSKIVNKTNALCDTQLASLVNPLTLNFATIAPLTCQIEHRLEKVATINGIEFYNDSKATTTTSTIAAVQKLASKNSPIILILGGLSKGVDRSTMISEIKKYVKQVISFGKEAEILKSMCEKENIACQSFATLDEAVNASFLEALPGYQIALSPSGSSFDLFKDYQERGRIFKQIVLELTNQEK